MNALGFVAKSVSEWSGGDVDVTTTEAKPAAELTLLCAVYPLRVF